MPGIHDARRVAVLRRMAAASAIAVLFSSVDLAAQPQSGPQVQPVVVGLHVNMVGGPTLCDPATGLGALPLVGDPFLQRQNEPSPAVSWRNPGHLLAAANDYVLTCSTTDGLGNTRTATRTVTDANPPTMPTASVNPPFLWSPNGELIPVTVSGETYDAESGIAQIRRDVVDGYNQHTPTGTVAASKGSFSVQIPLLADRRGHDKDGRHYTIRLMAVDVARKQPAAGAAAGGQRPRPERRVARINSRST